jgi:3'-phosphoadenosine 5'-phosphosulfate sulfotransferase (PAPS reductase)/FAD synthetase
MVWDLDLIVTKNTSKVVRKVSHMDKSSHCNLLKKDSLKQVVSQHYFDTIMLALYRNEHDIRTKERDLSWTFSSGLIVLCELR